MVKVIVLIFLLLIAGTSTPGEVHIKGTWRLIYATSISNGKREITNYTKDQSMIKIINDTHFCFLQHRTGVAKDSSNKFDAGGGRYTLKGNRYTEYLEYYNDKNWEGQSFNFTVSMNNDTLVQQGIEKMKRLKWID